MLDKKLILKQVKRLSNYSILYLYWNYLAKQENPKLEVINLINVSMWPGISSEMPELPGMTKIASKILLR